MLVKNLYVILFSICVLSLSNCQTNTSLIKLSDQNKLMLLDSTKAAQAIVVDETEGFFENISFVDMDIQTKGQCSDNCIHNYKAYLQSDVEDFTNGEKTMMTKIFNTAYESIKQLNPDIFPPQIRLIKTKTKHYGPSVYYTRDDLIIIPANELARADEAALLSVMYHEIFHILSRYNKDLIDKLYALVGFNRVPSDILIPDAVKNILLQNPDGISQKHLINLSLKNSGRKLKALPLIVSQSPKFNEASPAFFSYLKFDLYEVVEDSNGRLKLICDEQGFSTVSIRDFENFFSQIKDNTQYIIHPDEIMADNFMLLLGARSNDDFSKFSEEGKALLMDVESTLKAHQNYYSK